MANTAVVSLGGAEAAFNDVLGRFLAYSSESANLNHALHLARALGQYFAFCKVDVVWTQCAGVTSDPQEILACGARWLPHRDEQRQTEELTDSEIRGFVDDTIVLTRKWNVSGIEIELSEDGAEPWIFLLSGKRRGGLEETKIDTLRIKAQRSVAINEGDPRWEMVKQRAQLLRAWESRLQMIHTTFVALRRPSVSAQIAASIRGFIGKVEMSPAERFDQAIDLVRSLSSAWVPASAELDLLLARGVVESVVQAFVGNGADLSEDVINNCESRARRMTTAVGQLQKRGESAKIDRPGLALERLLALCRTVEAMTGIENICDGGSLGRSEGHQWTGERSERELMMELDLIADWTSLHQLARRRGSEREKGSRESPAERWYPWALRTLVDLQGFLRVHFRAELEVAYLPAWLRLWFCQRLLLDGGEKGWNRWHFCEHLAYVIRESLRVFVFGQRTDYVFRPSELATALRTVVEQHAVEVIRLPSEQDIRGLLDELSTMQSDVGYMFTAGHLQHVLEVYIAGQFICELEVVNGESDDVWTVEQILASRSAWKPLRLSTGEFRRAFSLAALFHDVSRLLLPRWQPCADRWQRVDRTLWKGLSGLEGGFQDSFGKLMADCAKDLQGEGYFHTAAEPAVLQWVNERVERKEVDFPLVSAWFLHRLCQNVHGLQGDTVRQAVRAVLFHQMVTQPLEVDRDPAATLLVLCDQIFAWDSAKTWASPAAVGHSFQSIAAEIKPQPTLFEKLTFTGLELVKADPSLPGAAQALRFIVRRTVDQDQSWPHFAIVLRDSEVRETPTHRIWISLAQNLGRISPSRRHSWGPCVTVLAKVPKRLRRRQLSTYRLLEDIANQNRSTLRTPLTAFLKVVESFIQKKGEEELIKLGTLSRPLYREDLTYYFPELERLQEEILRRGEE